MFIIRNTFIAKPGCAGKLAAQFKDAVAAFQMPEARVMTDMTGNLNTVIMEYTAGSLAEFEKRIQEIIGSQCIASAWPGIPSFGLLEAARSCAWFERERDIRRRRLTLAPDTVSRLVQHQLLHA